MNVAFTWLDPSAYQRTVEAEERIKNRDSRDPDQAPAPEKGDRILLLVAFFGIIIGGILGFVIGNSIFGQGAILSGVLIGVIVGGLIGILLGNFLKKKMNEINDQNHLNMGM